MGNVEETNNSESSSGKKEQSKEKLVVPISEKDIILKESIRTQKVTNTPNFISELEPLYPK